MHFPAFSMSECCWLPDLPPRSSPVQQTGAYLPFSFHTRYHLSSLTVFWRLGLRQYCCSPLTRVHSVTLQGKGTGHRGTGIPPCSRSSPCQNGPGGSHPAGQGKGFPALCFMAVMPFPFIKSRINTAGREKGILPLHLF